MDVVGVRRVICGVVDELVDRGVIDRRDRSVAKLVLALFWVGADREMVKRIVGRIWHFDFYWRNLERCGVIRDGCVVLGGDVDLSDDCEFIFELCLLINLAYGYLKLKV